MSVGKTLFVLIVLASVCSYANAWCKCHECISSMTLNLQLTDERYAGTDNEVQRNHLLDMVFLCNAHVLNKTQAHNIMTNIPDIPRYINPLNITIPPFAFPTVAGFHAVPLKYGLSGIMMKSQTRVFNIRLPSYLRRLCGGCVSPIKMAKAVLRAGSRDGIDVQSASLHANFQDRSASILTIDHGFDDGFLDVGTYPRDDAKLVLPLTKAGC